MGSGARLQQRSWLLKMVFVLAICFAAGLVTAGVVSGAGPLAALSIVTETDTTTESTETSTDTTSTDPTGTEPTGTEPTGTEPTDTEPTETTPTDTTPTETTPTWPDATEPYLVRFASGTTVETQGEILAAAGAEDLSYVRPLRIHGVLLPGDDSLQASLAVLDSFDSVTRVEPDREREAGEIPNDSGYGDQWSLPKIGWENVFGTVPPSGSARVAILDTGIDGAHSDLDGNVVPGTSLLDGSDGLSDPNGHGTAMAGIVAAETNNGAGVAGVAYAGVQVMPVTVLDSDGTGQDSDVIEGVVYAADNGADVILMAFSNPGYSELLQEAIDYAWEEGVVLVAAAGNDGSSTVTFPAGDRGVIGVSNTDQNDALNASSNYGQAVFLGAPGTGIATTSAGGGTTSISGTSAAAAHVAGAAALIKAASGASNGVVVSRLARNAEPAGSQDQTGNGRLNVDRAIADESTDSIQPAGADPVGSGGPIVGPYVAASPDIWIDIAPTQYPAAASATARTFSVLVHSRNGGGSDTVGCVRINFPSAYGTIALVSNGTAVSTGVGTWNVPVVDSANDRISWTATSNTNRLGAGGWGRLTFTVDVPAGSGSDSWTIVARNSINTSGGNNCATASPDTSKTQGIRRGTVTDTYTTAFVGSSTAVTGVATPLTLTVTKNTSGGLKIHSAVVAFPACFTLSSPVMVPGAGQNKSLNWEATARDGVLRLYNAGIGSGAPLENANDFVQVTLSATAAASCDASSTVLTSAFEGEARAGTAADKVHADADGTHPVITVGAANTAPTVAFTSPPTTADEGQTKTFNFTITDPDVGNTFTFVAGFPKCGTGGTLVGGSASINSVAKTGTFQCSFPDGPANPTVEVRVQDNSDAQSNTASQAVVVSNVQPSIAISGATSVNEGSSYSLTLGAVTDPGTDTVTSYVVHWGDGSDDAYTTNGVKTHTYADGPATRAITVDLVDEDGTHLNRANPFSMQVDNVAPSIAITGAASVDEGSSYSLTLGAVSDPGTDTVTSYVVHWGDGSDDTYTTAGAKTHTYADGPATRAITVDLVDEDGTHLNRANAHSVTVANVAPDVTAPANQTADEGTSNTFDLGSFTDPGDDDPWEVTVDWGDGSADTVFNETAPGAIADKAHTYADNGTFTVTVTVDEEAGAGVSGSATFQVTVANVPPDVTAPADQTASEGTAASFALGSFTDPGDDDPWEVTVAWGDGSADTVFTETAPGAIAAKMHTYADDGTFTVTVTVDEDAGAGVSDSATFTVTVANVAPNVTAPADQTASEGTSKVFDLGSFTDPGDDDPWEVTVDWGDGSADTVFTETAPGAIADKAHAYADDGTFTVTVTVDEDAGAGVSGSATFQVAVANVAPNVTAPAAQTADEATSKVFDLGSFTDPGDDDPWEVTVDWGDGSLDTVFTETAPGAIADKAHTYADDGSYTVTITVKEDNGTGASGSATFQVAVANLPPVISNVSAESPIDEGDSSTVTVTASDPAGANDPLSYEFDCDGNNVFEVGPQASNSHDCPFADNGTFTVNVRVTDDDGGADTGSDTVQVQNVAPMVTAPANQTASEGTSSMFDLGSFTDPGDDDPWEVTVDWGDGSLATVFNETAPGAIADKAHTYADDGTFTVTVTVDEDAGAGVSGSATFQVTVANVPPEVTAPADQTASEGTSTTFDLGSFTDPGDDDPWEVTVAWGDGSADTVFTETAPGAIADKPHTYADDGLYTVTIAVDEDNGAGASGSATFKVTVANVAPEVTPPADQTASEGTSKTFDLGSFTDPGADSPWKVTVDWGDPSADTVFTEPSPGAITDKSHTYADNGNFTVTITVQEENGSGPGIDTATFQVAVANVAPTVAKPTFQPALIGCQTSTTLTGISFSDPGTVDSPWIVDIDWGDASPHTTYPAVTQGAQPDQPHTYTTPGSHTATVTVTDKDGGTGSETSTAPVSVFQYSVEFRPPVDGSTATSVIVNKMKNGRVVPVKVKIRDLCAGADLTDSSNVVTIKVTKSSGTSGVGDPVEEYADAGSSSGGTNEFRWSSEHWIYNLDSKALGLVIGNRYRIDVYVNGVRATVASWAIIEPVK